MECRGKKEKEAGKKKEKKGENRGEGNKEQKKRENEYRICDSKRWSYVRAICWFLARNAHGLRPTDGR